MQYYVESELTPKAYLKALRSKFRMPFGFFWTDRVTGVTIGPFFSIAYYSPYEWNRRITRECNRAFGRVLVVDGKTQVRFIYSKGLFSPSWLLFFFGLGMLMGWAYDLGMIWSVVSSIVFSLLACGYTAFADSLTEAGVEGGNVLTSLLYEPDQFYYC